MWYQVTVELRLPLGSISEEGLANSDVDRDNSVSIG